MFELTSFQIWIRKIYNEDYDLADDLNIATVRARMIYLSKRHDDAHEDILERAEQRVDTRELICTPLTEESSEEMLSNALVFSYEELIREELEIIEEYEEDLEMEYLEAQYDGLEQAKREKAAEL